MLNSLKKFSSIILLFLLVFCLSACSNSSGTATLGPSDSTLATETILPLVSSSVPSTTDQFTSMPISTTTPKPTKTVKPTATPTPTPSHTKTTSNKPLSGYIIGIDPGHQLKGNTNKEPNAPGSSVYKAKVTYGATGNTSKVREQLINLQVALKLQTKLKNLGATVVMTRTTSDVNISNVERAKIFNNAKVDFGIRIHCDSASATSAHGISVLIPDSKNNASIFKESERLANSLIDQLCTNTGAANRGVIQRNDQTGFNWSNVPVVTVEMGFLSNASEEAKLITSSYQDILVGGYVDGILQYIKN